jgi:flagellar biosynthesis repressor protein FlbT
MALKVELKPGEKLLVGNCIITNSDQRTRLFIEGRAPISRAARPSCAKKIS